MTSVGLDAADNSKFLLACTPPVVERGVDRLLVIVCRFTLDKTAQDISTSVHPHSFWRLQIKGQS